MSLTILSVDAQHQPRISTENPILSFHTSALTVGFRFQSIPLHEATTPGRWKLEEFRWQGPRQDTCVASKASELQQAFRSRDPFLGFSA